MRRVQLTVRVRGRSAADVYPILCDFAKYEEHSDAVRSVRILAGDDGRTVSSWEVNFHQGILRWTEEDVFDPLGYTIRFSQLEGDVDSLSGQWAVRDVDDGCVVRFTADFDLGIPSLSDILEPIAERALRDNVRSILSGLLGDSVQLVGSDGAEATEARRSGPAPR